MAKTVQRIFLATEHGEFDVGAERMAIELAAQQGASLHAVIAIASNPEAESVAPEWMDQADDAATSALSEIAARAESHGIAYSSEICHCDDLAQGFAEKAREYQADLLVVRRRGRRGWLSRLLVGEMVSQLIDQSPCDVLIAPRFAQMWSKGALALTDSPARESLAVQRGGTLVADAGVALITAPLTPQAFAQARESVDLVLMDLPRDPRHRLGRVREAVIGAAECPVWLCLSA